MPLLGYIFHFPAIVFHNFYEKRFQTYVKLAPWARATWPGPMGPGPMARPHGPRPQGPAPWAQAPGPGPMGPGPMGPGPRARPHGPRPQGPGPGSRTYCARILIEGARFPPFGLAIAEISPSSNEYVSFCQKDLLCPHSDRGRSVSPLRVRHRGDKL